MQTPTIERPRLLLIEDDDVDALLVERALERFPGFELRHVGRMQIAIDTLSSEQFDVALLDLSLPDSFGLDGVTVLRSRFPDLPIVVLTGLDEDERALEALERGAQDYLSKGQCSPEILSRALRYSIQRQQIQGENRRLLGELARQAREDALTGILNRRSLLVELEREWQRAERTGDPLSCVMFDVDYFKRINDTHGHAAGDRVLKAIANKLCKLCRPVDVALRYGGEEFLVLLPHTDEAGAIAWAERLRHAIAAMHILVGDQTIHITASFGVAESKIDADNGEELVDRADQAVRLAKHLGRHQVVTYRQTTAQLGGADNSAQEAFARLTAGEIMTPLVATLEESATLQEATEFLLNLRLDSAPIVNTRGEIIGVIGEEKLAQVLASANAWHRPVCEVMHKKPICFTTQNSAAAIQEFLARSASRRVIILEGQKPVGIVSRASILRWREHQALANRSLLADLSHGTTSPDIQYESLLRTVTEIETQASRLSRRLIEANDSPAESTVAAATSISSLLESAVMLSQRLDARYTGQCTISEMVG